MDELRRHVVVPEKAQGASSLVAESPERIQMFEVRDAYDRLKLKANPDQELLGQLTTLGRGLVSENAIVRNTTGDIVRHILTAWVRERPQSDWHQSLEIDEFFRLYKQSSDPSLAEFLKAVPVGPETQYLKTI